MVLGFKGGRFDSLGMRAPREHTHHRNTFWVQRAKIHASQCELCMRWRNQEREKVKELRNYANPTTTICGGHRNLYVGRTVDIIKRAKFYVNCHRA